MIRCGYFFPPSFFSSFFGSDRQVSGPADRQQWKADKQSGAIRSSRPPGASGQGKDLRVRVRELLGVGVVI